MAQRGSTALDLALANRKEEAAAVLRVHGAQVSLFFATEKGMTDEVAARALKSQNIVGTTPAASWQGWQPADDTLLSTLTFAILDTETTGLSKKDLIAEIAIKKVRGDGTTLGATWSSLVNPAPRCMGQKAAEITGLSDAILREPSVPKFATIHSRVCQEVGEGCVVVGK